MEILDLSRREVVAAGAAVSLSAALGCATTGRNDALGPASESMRTVTRSGVEVRYRQTSRGRLALLGLPGWCSERTMFEPMAKLLAPRWPVLLPNWRGHGDSGGGAAPFSTAELVEDTLAVIEDSGAEQVVPIAVSHAGWIALELRRRLGARVPRIVLVDWIVLDPPPPFLGALAALQDPDRWLATRDALFEMWFSTAPVHVSVPLKAEMARYPAEMWGRAGREISASYAANGPPLAAFAKLQPPLPVLHLYSQPKAPEYLEAQRAFAAAHPWFEVHQLEGSSHFPTLESPGKVASRVEAFLDSPAPSAMETP